LDKTERQTPKINGQIKMTRRYSHVKKQWARVGGKKHYWKSNAEYKYAKCLEFLRTYSGDISQPDAARIFRWTYEPERITLNFPDNNTKYREYKPDFEVIYEGGEVWLIEIKGQLTSSEAKKLLTFRLYYPKKNLMLLIDGLPIVACSQAWISYNNFALPHLLPRRLTTEGIRRWKRIHKIMDAGIKVSNLRTVFQSFKKTGVL